MIDLSTEEWREALRLVRAAADAEEGTPSREEARAAAFDFMRTASSKRILSLAHLLQPGATGRSIQAALVPLERVDGRARVTDAEMGIRTTDAPRPSDRADMVVVADNIRRADFFGASRIILCGYTPTPENQQVRKTALGADEAVPWEHIADIRDAIDAFRREGRRIYALETVDGATPIERLAPVFPCALLLGNERFGLDPDVVRSADEIVEIPSHGQKNSLNVVSALAVAAAFMRA